MTISTPRIFAPTKDPCRGDLTLKYLFKRWFNYLKAAGIRYEFHVRSLKELADEFQYADWSELRPYYLEFHEFEEDGRRTEFEKVFLGIGYGQVLRAGRIAEE